MRGNRFFTGLMLAVLMLICASAPARGQGVEMGRDLRNRRIELSSLETVISWEENGTRVFVMSGGGSIKQGQRRLVAPRMVVWFDTAASPAGENTEAVVHVYAEGDGDPGEKPSEFVLAEDETGPSRPAALLETFRTRAAFAWDAPLRRVASPEYSLLWARAQALREQNGEDRSWESVPDPDEIAPPPAIEQVLQAEHPIYLADQNAAVFIGDVHGSYADLNLRADSAVLWVDPDTGRYEIYAEGDVRISPKYDSGRHEMFGQFDAELQVLKADRLYINPRQDRARVDDAELRIRRKDGPLYVMRGERLYMLDASTFTMEEVSFTNCPFVDPHYKLSAARVQVTETNGSTPVAATDVRLQVGENDRTLLWIPFLGTDISRRSFIISDFAVGSDDKFGTFVQTAWRPFDLVSANPEWLEYFDLFLDYYSDRGFAIGHQMEYEFGTDIPNEGMMRSYFINDDADFDDTGLPVTEDQRGRFHWRHRAHLNDQWRVDAEYYWLSDHGFRQEFFEQEFEEEKDPETYAQLRYLSGSTWGALRYRTRVNDFFTRVEELPSATLEFMAMPWGLFVYDGTFSFGRYDLEVNDRISPPVPDPPEVLRTHLDQSLSMPFDVAFLRFRPFLRAAATWADESRVAPGVYGDSAARFILGGGLDLSARFWRTFDVQSERWGIDRLRHIATPYVRAEHLAAFGDGSEEFIQMDRVDALDTTTEFRLGMRNRLQTRRRSATGQWKSVDWMELDVAYVDRESDSISPLIEDQYIRADFLWRITDRFELHSRDNRISLNDRPDILNLGVNVDFSPNVTFTFDYDYLTDIAQTITGELAMKLSDHYALIVYEQYQLESDGGDSTNLETRITLRRFLHEWVIDLGLKIEEGNDDNTAIMVGFGPRGWGIFRDPRRSRR